MKKFLLLIILFSFKIFAADIDIFISRKTIALTKKEIYVKIFKYSSFTPRQIRRLEKIGYNKNDILLLSAIFLFVDDNFSVFVKKVSEKKNIKTIIDYYGLNINIVMNEVDNILSIDIDDEDFVNYKEYDKIVSYDFSMEAGLIGSFYYSFSGGVYIYPFDLLDFSIEYDLEKYPVENDFYVMSKVWNFELDINPIELFNISCNYSYGIGDVNYNYRYLSFIPEIDIDKTSLYGGVEINNELYVTNITNNLYKTNVYTDLFLGMEYYFSDTKSISITYKYIKQYNNLIGHNVLCDYYTDIGEYDLYFNYSFFWIPLVKNSHSINPEIKFKYSNYINFYSGIDIDVYNTITSQTETITVYNNFGSPTTETKITEVITTQTSFIFYVGVDIYF